MRNTTEQLTMGIGSGDTNLFVSGDYRSITELQNKLFELEELRRENISLKHENIRLQNIGDELHPMDYICLPLK